GLLGSLFGDRRRDKSWFYLHTNIVPVTGVDYAVTSKLGTTYMPVKGRQNDIGFDTAKRKQFEQQLLTTIKQLDDTLTAQLTDEYLQAARQAVTGQQFSGVWRTDKKEKLKTILENLLYQRYATALAAIDGRILKFFDKNEEIGQALTNIGSVLGTFKDLNDTAKQFIFNISQSDLDKLKNYGYSYSQIFASFVNLTNQVPDFVEQIQNVMDKTGADLVSAFETLQSRVFYISTITANTLTNIDFSVDWNTFKSTIITNFKQQFVNQLYQVFINGISEQITSSLLLNYNTDLENLWSGFWNGSVSLNALYDAINIVNDILDKNLNKWNELKQILNQLGLETEKNIDLWATLNDNIINLYNEAKSNLISTYSPEKTFLYYRTQLFSNIEQLTNASVEKGSELVNTISSLLSSSITSGKSHFTSEYEYRKFIATIMARMNEAEIYRFKYGGTVEGPESGYTTFVEFHGKEHIVPDNNLEGIKKELSDIREILRYILSASGEQVKTSKKTYSIITKWDVNGVVTTSQ
uniref:hypothetical protein n=1 Tax=Thermoanaerobacter sp. A7A TaxID=1350366 RepID=UPI00235B5DF0